MDICKTCQHWGRSDFGVSLYGECKNLLNYERQTDNSPIIVNFLTREDYGCTHHKEKPTPPWFGGRPGETIDDLCRKIEDRR